MHDERADSAAVGRTVPTEKAAQPASARRVTDCAFDDGLVRPHVARAHPDRARQFMPFAALKGYYDLVRDCERIIEPRHEATEEDVARISARLADIRKGSIVRAVHYAEHEGSYVETSGAVARIDPTFQTMVVAGTSISFSDLADIEIVG